jgi:acyl carrier protein
VHDNFFDLGGDSLTFLQVTRQLRDKLGITLPAKKLLQNPTVHEIAQELHRIRSQ